MSNIRGYELCHKDVFWVSKDLVDKDTTIILGDYYCINEYNKFEIYENQTIYNGKLFLLTEVTFSNNVRKWYQFWKPQRIINGYKFQYIDLEEK